MPLSEKKRILFFIILAQGGRGLDKFRDDLSIHTIGPKGQNGTNQFLFGVCTPPAWVDKDLWCGRKEQRRGKNIAKPVLLFSKLLSVLIPVRRSPPCVHFLFISGLWMTIFQVHIQHVLYLAWLYFQRL